MVTTFNTASVVYVLLTLSTQVPMVTSLDTCNYRKWIMCEKGMSQSAQYSLPKYVRVENFLCDTQTDGGGWIIFQRRFNQDTDFNRSWAEYKKGFGSKCKDHWLGNDYLHIATKWGKYELRIDMVLENQSHFAQYSNFKVGSEKDNYRLTVTGFTGDVTSNDFEIHSGYPFSTYDVNNSPADDKCGIDYTSGWWHHGCVMSNLNGEFDNTDFAQGVHWLSLTDENTSLAAVEMKLRLQK